MRHIFGRAMHKSTNIDGLPPVNATVGGECNVLAANADFVAFPVAGPGGQIAVVGTDGGQRLGQSVPVLQHPSAVLDFALDPFCTCRMAVACEDAVVYTWEWPRTGLAETLETPAQRLRGHASKVNLLRYHPLASDTLLSAGFDGCLKLWDLVRGVERVGFALGEPLFGAAFSDDGTQLACVARDRSVRIYDPRTGTLAQRGAAHEGARGMRLCWLGSTGRLATTGFDRCRRARALPWRCACAPSVR